MANIGLGSLDVKAENEFKESSLFYQKLGEFANEKGISISLLTLRGEACNAEVIGKLAEKTNGNVTRLDPEDISKNFANILKDEIVGTNVTVEVRLHKCLRFRNEEAQYLFEDGSVYRKNLGNATSNMEVISTSKKCLI